MSSTRTAWHQQFTILITCALVKVKSDAVASYIYPGVTYITYVLKLTRGWLRTSQRIPGATGYVVNKRLYRRRFRGSESCSEWRYKAPPLIANASPFMISRLWMESEHQVKILSPTSLSPLTNGLRCQERRSDINSDARTL